MFNLIKSEDPLQVQNINVLIYGEPGIGKTSLASTANNPLLLDFDGGAHRSAFRKDVIQINNWSDISENMNQFLKVIDKYDTIIIDTIDKLLDSIGEHLKQKEPRYENKLKLQFYGVLKTEFTNFTKRLRLAKKDLIFLCHVKEEMNGDIKEKRPLITGGSKDAIYQNSDFIGYYSKQQNNRVLDFDPNEYYFAKNCANVSKIVVSDFKTEPHYFESIMDMFKKAINELTSEQKELIDTINAYKQKIESLTNLDGFNGVLNELKPMNKNIKIQLWNLLEKESKKYPLAFNEQTKLFIEVANEN